MLTKKQSDFRKIKALIFDKKLRAKYNVDEDDLRRLLRKYAQTYNTGNEERIEIRQSLCDISDLDNYIKGFKNEIQQDNRGQYYF